MKKTLQKIFGIFNYNELVLLAILIAVVLAMGIHSPKFLSLENLTDILRSASFFGILTVGFLFVLVAGGLDISFMATAIIAQYLTALLLTANQNTPIVLIILLPIAIGILLGSGNALLIHYLKAPPIIVSIACMNTYYGIIQYASGGKWLYDFPRWFSEFPTILVVQFEGADGLRYGLSIFTVIWLAIACAGHIVLQHTTLGRKLYATGGNLEAARRAGINIWYMRWFSYAFLGGIAGIGALVHALTTQTVAPNALWGQEFDVVTAVVVGGAAITGGSGSIAGAVIGTLLVAVVKNGLTIMRVPSYWHQVFIGGILLLSVVVTTTKSRMAANRAGGIHARQ